MTLLIFGLGMVSGSALATAILFQRVMGYRRRTAESFAQSRAAIADARRANEVAAMALDVVEALTDGS